MKLSIFELIMLLTFGVSWPFSIYKSYTSKSTQGKSLVFLSLILVGYASGIVHKLLYSKDIVIYFYALNFIMVLIDMCLYFRNKKLMKENEKND